MVTQRLNFPRNQTLLHQKLKLTYLNQVEGTEEVSLDVNGRKYRIDVLDNEKNTAYEIHRSNFGGKFSQKINALLKVPLTTVIVHPIVLTQKVTRMNHGKILSISHYTKYGDLFSFFENLVHFKVEFVPQRMEFDVVYIKEHVLKELVGYYRRSMRRKYQTVERDLISIEKVQKFKTKSDFINIMPNRLPNTFTNRDLAERLETKGNKRRIQRLPGLITYSLCELGILHRVGKQGRAYEFSFQN